MRDCDAVIHLAAVADVGHVLADPVLAEEVNTRGTLNVLEAAAGAKVGRVVYGSTTWVYSDCVEQDVDEETPIPAPRHIYTATKLAGETYCAGYAELYDLESTVLRFGIPYGPRARAAGVVAKFTDLSFEGKALTIAGDGSTTRSFIYVEDLADGIVAALAPEAAGRTYNLSGDEVVTILEIAERVQENVDNCEIIHTPPRPGDFPGKAISNERALEELGWKAETSFKRRRRASTSNGSAAATRPPDPIPGKQPSLNGNEHAAGALLSGAARSEERPPRVLVLTADIGEGHDLPARIIKADLEEEVPGAEVEIANGLDGDGQDLRRGPAQRLQGHLPLDALAVRHPVLADHQVRPGPLALPPPRLPDRRPRPAEADRRTRPGHRHLDLPRRHRGAGDAAREPAPRHPGAVGDHRPRRAALLGPPRRRPPLRHPPGVDRGGREAGRAGHGRVGAPADLARVPDAAHPPRRPRGARRCRPTPGSCSSPAAAGGSATSRARSARRSPATTPSSSASPAATRSPARSSRSDFGDNEQVRVLGFTEQMSDWMAAADAMIHATAGLTVLEAHIRGCPVVSYGFSAGHLRANNAAFERFGLAEVARSDHELESVLRHVTRERQSPDSSFASLPSIASRALSVRPQVRPQPVWRLRTERVAAAVAAGASSRWC